MKNIHIMLYYNRTLSAASAFRAAAARYRSSLFKTVLSTISIIKKEKAMEKRFNINKVKVRKYGAFLIYALISGFIVSSGISLNFIHRDTDILSIDSVKQVNVFVLLLITVSVAALIFALFFKKDKLYRSCIPLSLFFFSLIILYPSVSVKPYFYTVLAVTVVCAALSFKDVFKDREIKILEGRGLYIFVAAITALMTFAVSFGTIIRMYVFNSSAFDFGLFAQMFEYMATDLTQNTTLERNELLSHFAVHFSPIYYLMLPFYMIFRNPESLLAMQAAVCFSGVIPLLLLCKRWRYGGGVTLALCGMFLCYPALTGACFYDFHENCFLTPIILWVLYFLESDKRVGLIISAALLLCVKEDAGLYLVFIALYALFNKKVSKLLSVFLIIMGVCGFFADTAFINAYGEGIKVSRYDIFLTEGQDSLTEVVKNVIKNPAFFLSKLLTEEKLLFMLQMLLPLLFIPVKTRKISDWFLIAPFILINIATDYKYQYDINYQYVFGTGAMLIFLTVKNLRYSRAKLKLAVTAFMAAAVCLMGNAMPKYHYTETYFYNQERYQTADRFLKELPKDKIIYASTFLTPHLYDCKQVYMYPPIYNREDWTDAEIIVLDSRYYSGTELKEEMLKLEENGYVKTDEASFVIKLEAEKK